MTASLAPDWTRRTEPVEHTELQVIGEVGNPGATGTVYEIAGQPPCLYKKYINPSPHAARLDRLVAWRNGLSPQDRGFLDSCCAWPLVTVTGAGQTAGFLMRSAPAEFWADMGGEKHTLELQHLIHTGSAREFGIQLPSPGQRLALVRNLAEILAFFENHHIVYADVNERNVFWAIGERPGVFLIDCDNARPIDLPGATAGVAMPRNLSWRDPDLPEGRYPDTNSDRRSLAVFCYRVFYDYYRRPGDPQPALDQDPARVLIPDSAPNLPLLEQRLASGLGAPKHRPAAADWIPAIDATDLPAAEADNASQTAKRPAWWQSQLRLPGQIVQSVTARNKDGEALHATTGGKPGGPHGKGPYGEERSGGQSQGRSASYGQQSQGTSVSHGQPPAGGYRQQGQPGLPGNSGDHQGALDSSRRARTFVLVSTIILAVLMVIFIIIITATLAGQH